MTDKTQEPVAWINWCAATGKRSVSFECESELASQPLYEGITQNTQDHYSNFHSWFYSSPHRAKYSTDHPAYLAAQEAWEASSDLKKYNYTNGYCTGRTDLLAEQKSQQPVAWMYDVARYGPTDLRGQQWRPAISRTKPNMHDSLVRDMTPLYTSPQPAQQQEPVAIVADHPERIDWLRDEPPDGALLYTSPPASKPWVGLTDDDWDDILGESATFGAVIKLTEAKLREKNT